MGSCVSVVVMNSLLTFAFIFIITQSICLGQRCGSAKNGPSGDTDCPIGTRCQKWERRIDTSQKPTGAWYCLRDECIISGETRMEEGNRIGNCCPGLKKQGRKCV